MIPINLSEPVRRQRVLSFLCDHRTKKMRIYSSIVDKFVTKGLHFPHEIRCIRHAVPCVVEALKRYGFRAYLRLYLINYDLDHACGSLYGSKSCFHSNNKIK